MQIQIDDKHRIRSSASGWHLEYRTEKKGGGLSDRHIALGHYPDLRSAARTFIERGIRSLEATTLADAIAGMDEMIDKVVEKFKPPEKPDNPVKQEVHTPQDDIAQQRLMESEILTPNFKRWAITNWHIYRAFERRSLRLINLGFRHGGAREIVENIRWQSRLAEKQSEYKINNNHTPWLARAFSELNPRHRAFFRVKSGRKVGQLPDHNGGAT